VFPYASSLGFIGNKDVEQGTLTERESTVRLTSLYLLVLIIYFSN
jgi:hypothetical protein